jgi:peptide/nickel transport system substrate-binding protein
MQGGSHGTRGLPRRVSRRRLLNTAAWGGAGLAGAALLACGGGTKEAGQATTAPGGQSGQSAAQATVEAPRPGGTLRVYVPSNYPLDPQKVSALAQQIPGAAMSRVLRFKNGPSVTEVTDHNVEPDLAASVEAPDAGTWTVKLRPDAKFHDIAPVGGHAVEAEDIKATFIRALDPATGSPNRGALGMIDPAQIETPDKQTIVFKLTYPYAPFRKVLASASYSWIFPREVLSGGYDPARQVIGSGPYIMESVTPDVAYTYKKNPEWFDKTRGHIENLRIAVIPDPAQRLAQFSAGNLDELEINNAFDVATIKQTNPKALEVKMPNGNPNPLYLQLGDPSSPFVDIRVRRAISMAIDRDALGKVVFNGETLRVVYVPAYQGKWSLPVDQLDPAVAQYYKYNPAEAKKLLDAAGAANLQLKVVNPFASLGNLEAGKSVEVIAGMFNAIGIKTIILSLDYNKDFIGNGKAIRQGYFDKDMVIYGAASPYSESDEWLFSYFHSKSLSNAEHLSDPQYDALVDKMRTLVNEDERLKAVHDIQRHLADKLYAPSTAGTYRWMFVNPRVRNYNYSFTLGRSTEIYAKLWLQG